MMEVIRDVKVAVGLVVALGKLLTSVNPDFL